MDMNAAFIFAKVVEAQGFSAAGRLLAMPKTTVSKKVSDLETELGVRLLNRTTRSLSMTEAGARFYAHCIAAIHHIDQAERAAHALQIDPEGMLTIAAPGAIGAPLMLPAVTAFMRHYPAVQVTLLSVNELVDFDRKGVDVMIWAGISTPPGHAMQSIASAEMGLYASAAYLERYGSPVTPDELVPHAVVAFTQSMSGDRFVWDLQRDETRVQITPARLPQFCSNDGAAVLAAISIGCGIGSLPKRFVTETPTDGILIPVLPDWHGPTIDLSALYADPTSLKTRIFVEFIRDWFGQL